MLDVDANTVRKIVTAAKVTAADRVVEVKDGKVSAYSEVAA